LSGRLDAWLDEECARMTVGLSLTPERPTAETQEMVARFREAMVRSSTGRYLLLADQLEELWRTLPWVIRKPIEGWARLVEMVNRRAH
jgi:hypothetical protein